MNTVLEMPDVFSCAVDSFIELYYYAIFPLLKGISPNLTLFNDLIFSACQRYECHLPSDAQNMSVIYEIISYEVRMHIWSYICEKSPSFRAKDSNAQFSEIFQESVFGKMTYY